MALLDKLFQVIEYQSKPTPLDERDKEIDVIGGSDLPPEFIHESGFCWRSGEEAALRDRGLGADGCSALQCRKVATLHECEQDFCIRCDHAPCKGGILEFIGKAFDEVVADLDLLFQRDFLVISRLKGFSEDPGDVLHEGNLGVKFPEGILEDPSFLLWTSEAGCEVFTDDLFIDPGEQVHTLTSGGELKMTTICLSHIVARENTANYPLLSSGA